MIKRILSITNWIRNGRCCSLLVDVKIQNELLNSCCSRLTQFDIVYLRLVITAVSHTFVRFTVADYKRQQYFSFHSAVSELNRKWKKKKTAKKKKKPKHFVKSEIQSVVVKHAKKVSTYYVLKSAVGCRSLSRFFSDWFAVC